MLAMAVAAFAAPAMAQGMASAASGCADILGTGIFETEGSAFKFPFDVDTNFDEIIVGDDTARAFGGLGGGKFNSNSVNANAVNNLEIKKNQDSGACECCQAIDPSCPCKDCCTKFNIEKIKVGNRNAFAWGGIGGGAFNTNGAGANAENNVKVVVNQQ